MKSRYIKFLAIIMLFTLLLSGCQIETSQSQNQSSPKIITQTDQEFRQQGYGLFGTADHHQNNIKGDGIKIAILDTGVDLNSSDIRINTFKNFVESNNDIQDKNGHGTKLAGIISAKENNHGLLGIAPNAELYIGKVANDGGYVKTENLIAGIEWAIDQKVDIINLSLELYKGNDELHDAIKKADKAGILVVASSGNQIDDHSKRTVAFPAQYDEVISVGMLNENGRLSKHGFKDSKIKVYAPSEDIVATYLDDKLTLDTGASFATAYISGYSALLIQQFRAEGKSYDRNVVTAELQSIFNRYMGLQGGFMDVMKFAFGVTTILLAILLAFLLIYGMVKFRSLKEIFKVKKLRNIVVFVFLVKCIFIALYVGLLIFVK